MHAASPQRVETPSSTLGGGAHLWSKYIATQVPVHRAGCDAAVDGDGNLIIAGRFGGALDLRAHGGGRFSGQSGDVFIVKLDPAGKLLLADYFLGADPERARWSVATNARGDIAIAGETTEGLYLTKLDRAGRRCWTTRLSDLVTPAADRWPVGLAMDDDGAVVVSGHGTVGASSDRRSRGLAHLYVLAFEAGGRLRWTQRFPATGALYRPRVAVHPLAGIVVSGAFRGIVLLGAKPLQSGPTADRYVAELDRDGKPRWSGAYPGGETPAAGVRMDPVGNLVLGGAVRDAIDLGTGALATGGARSLFLAMIDRQHRTLWARCYPGDGRCRIDAEVDLAVSRDGGAFLAGYFDGAIDLDGEELPSMHENESMLVAKVDDRGRRRWARVFAGAHDQTGLAVRAGPKGSAYVLGCFAGSVDLGGELLTSAGAGLDLFVARLGT
jgi:hypothetical protein